MAPAQQEEATQSVEAIFRAWLRSNIAFLVLRNYEGLPAFTSNDIDVLVAPQDRLRAERTLLEAAESAGFRLHNRAQFATLALYLSSVTSTAQVHFDLFTDLKWRGFDFLCCREFLARKVDRGLFAVPHPADEAVTNLLASMIFTGNVKDKYKSAIASAFRQEPALTAKLLARTYGARHAQFVTSAAGREEWAQIEERTAALRRAAVVRQLTRQPFQTFASLLADAWRLAGRWLSPPGMTIVLLGADGSGKSTVADGIIETMSRTFSPQKGRRYHWKPPVFSASRQAARGPTTDPHAAPERGRVPSLFFFTVHWLEFLLGYWLRIRPVLFRGGLVLIDRYYYDFFVDQKRYRLRVPLWLVRCGYWFLPKPDLVLLLDAPAEVLRSRKQELPPAEIERQRTDYRALAEGLSHAHVVDAGQPPGKVAEDATRAILELLRFRRAGREEHLPI
jgi:thymidylate kinase